MRRDVFLDSLLGVGLALTLAFGLFRAEAWVRKDLRVTLWDVGQGDAILIRFPDRSHWMIDAAGRMGRGSVAARVLLPELATQGVFLLERLILSHPDEDHAFGVFDLVSKGHVRELWVHPAFSSSENQPPVLREILNETTQNQTTVRYPMGRSTESIGGVLVTTYPVVAGTKSNNRELVVLLQFRGCRLLFLGDSEREAENFMVEHLNGPVDFLKVAHHGSKTSSTPLLLQSARPTLSAISVGARNQYGHPHPSVVERLRSRGVVLLRTDRHGFLDFRVTREGTIHCRSASGLCGEYRCRGAK